MQRLEARKPEGERRSEDVSSDLTPDLAGIYGAKVTLTPRLDSSFPRKNVTPADSKPGRESRLLLKSVCWIPAFAGMTTIAKMQNTPDKAFAVIRPLSGEFGTAACNSCLHVLRVVPGSIERLHSDVSIADKLFRTVTAAVYL